MSRTTVIILVGLALLIIFLVVGYLLKSVGVRRATEDFILVWFALAAGNLAIGVFEAGYTLAEELPIFALIFAVPGVPAILLRTLATRQRHRGLPNEQR